MQDITANNIVLQPPPHLCSTSRPRRTTFRLKASDRHGQGQGGARGGRPADAGDSQPHEGEHPERVLPDARTEPLRVAGQEVLDQILDLGLVPRSRQTLPKVGSGSSLLGVVRQQKRHQSGPGGSNAKPSEVSLGT